LNDILPAIINELEVSSEILQNIGVHNDTVNQFTDKMESLFEFARDRFKNYVQRCDRNKKNMKTFALSSRDSIIRT
jgi:hypothetical protein